MDTEIVPEYKGPYVQLPAFTGPVGILSISEDDRQLIKVDFHRQYCNAPWGTYMPLEGTNIKTPTDMKAFNEHQVNAFSAVVLIILICSAIGIGYLIADYLKSQW